MAQRAVRLSRRARPGAPVRAHNEPMSVLALLPLACSLCFENAKQDTFPATQENWKVFDAVYTLQKEHVLAGEFIHVSGPPATRSEILTLLRNTFISSQSKFQVLKRNKFKLIQFTLPSGERGPITETERKSISYLDQIKWAGGFLKCLPSFRILLKTFAPDLPSIGLNPNKISNEIESMAKEMKGLPIGLGRPFEDIDKKHWAADAIEELREHGLIIGFPGGSFNWRSTTTAKAS
jgi:hypothetical protein